MNQSGVCETDFSFLAKTEKWRDHLEVEPEKQKAELSLRGNGHRTCHPLGTRNKAIKRGPPLAPSSLCPGHSLLIVEHEGLRLAGLDNMLASQCPGHQDRGSASLPSVRAVNIVPDTALGPWKQQRNPQRSLSSWHGDQRRLTTNNRYKYVSNIGD